VDISSPWPRHAPELSDRDLAVIVRLVYEKSGITLHAGKRALIVSRLQKRLATGGFGDFREYVRNLQDDPSGEEVAALLDAIATNHTSFFREPQHFAFLAEVALPRLTGRREGRPILGWSAACSTGEEAYTIAMTMFEQLGEDAGRRMRLLASDLSSKALARARAGVYKAERVADLPRHLVTKYFVKRSGAAGDVQVADSLRRIIEFRRLNLLRPPPPGPPLDFIFCRNVMIYFDREVQQRVVQALAERLAPGGFLFTSHAESLNGLRHGLTWIAPSIWRRDGR
jgi:chemotaxis protein methyltransferase CheR